jgi:precorrin-3B synthase
VVPAFRRTVAQRAADAPETVVTAIGQARGECPSVRRPMTAGDGLLARVRLAGGTLTPDQARALAAAAGRYGNGVVELTSRANVQVRGVRPESLDALVGELVAAGLVAADPDDEPSADVVVPPLTGADATALLDVRPLADELRTDLRVGRTGPLHHKAGVVLDGGGAGSPPGPAADVLLATAHDTSTGEVVLEVVIGGPTDGTDTGDRPVVAPADAPELVTRVLTLAARGTDAVPGPARVGDLVAAHGEARTLALAGVAHSVRTVRATDLHRPVRVRAEATPLGVVPGDGDRGPLVGVLPPLGRLDAAGLRNLADAAARHGATDLRVTPGRGVLVPGVGSAVSARALLAELAGLGFVVAPDDPAAGVIACAGRPGCPASHADTQGDARRLAAALLAGGRRLTVHVSGCAKRCASRRPHDVTLIAEPDGAYAVLVGQPESLAGRTPDVATALAFTLAAEPTEPAAGPGATPPHNAPPQQDHADGDADHRSAGVTR